MNKITINIATSNEEFVGLECTNNNLTITFPIGYTITPKTFNYNEETKIKEYQEDITTLLKVLENSPLDKHYNTGQNQFSYSSALYLINDYFKNGLIKSYTPINNKQNIGKINWSQTIHKKNPILDQGNFIYIDTISRHKDLIITDLTNIQIYCLSKCFKILGLFYHNYTLKCKTLFTKEEMLYKINQYLNKTNIILDRKRLTIMKNFIEGTDFSAIGEKEYKIGSNYFNTIWEKLLRDHFYHLYPQIEDLPKAYYNFLELGEVDASSLIPDIIFIKDKVIYIIDAKYYKINTFPQTQDISKQLFYAMYLKEKYPNYKINNIFLLPNSLDTDTKYLGYATIKAYEQENGGKINTFYVNTKKLLTSNINIIL